MVWFSKKDNGINWQQEVFEISKIMPTLVEKLTGMDNKYDEHVKAGRAQRTEDKKEKEENRDQLKAIDLKLAKAIECPKSEQIEANTDDIKIFKTDKELKKGKFLGMKLIWAIVLAVFLVTMFVLNVLWKFRML